MTSPKEYSYQLEEEVKRLRKLCQHQAELLDTYQKTRSFSQMMADKLCISRGHEPCTREAVQ